MKKEEILNKIALDIFYETFDNCSDNQKKQVLKKYYHEQEKIGVCDSCGTSCDYDVFKCPNCGSPLTKPLRTEQIKSDMIIINKAVIVGNGNVTIQGSNNSNVVIGGNKISFK